jgi:DNA-binding GntR family transcriptional regulator
VIDKLGPTPLYLQVADDVQRRIESGELQPNRPIASENYMVQTYDVSRGTVRKAVEELRKRGLVFTVPQRGTYVADRSAQ